MLLLWIAVLTFHENARWVGGGWMLFGLVAYVVYRRFVERTSLTKRVSVPEEALRKEVREAEYGDILVPVFGTELDDDIVSTAGRLADAADEPGEERPRLEVIYVLDLPLTVPLDAPPPKERLEAARGGPAARPGGGRGVRDGRGRDGRWCRRAAWAPGSSTRRGGGTSS